VLAASAAGALSAATNIEINAVVMARIGVSRGKGRPFVSAGGVS
jgi:hypothetical protein